MNEIESFEKSLCAKTNLHPIVSKGTLTYIYGGIGFES